MTKLEIFEKIDELIKRDNLFICISGRSCSGKTTLANEIKEKFHYCNPLVICQDMWYKDLRCIVRGINGYYNMESPDAFEVDELKGDIEYLRETGHCFVPYYDISKNQRISKGNEVMKSSMVILEGLHTIDIFEGLDSVCSVFYIFVDTPLEVCANRRVNRDIKFIELSPIAIRKHYLEITDPHYNESYKFQKEIVENKGDRGVVLNE